jgi:cyclopropane fatty-acyl-phospholipid synthase-like methyltransferase
MVGLDAFNAPYATQTRPIYRVFSLREGDRVLDIGCGDGFGSRWLAGNVGENGAVVAIDLSPTRLASAAANSRAKTVHLGRADSLLTAVSRGRIRRRLP